MKTIITPSLVLGFSLIVGGCAEKKEPSTTPLLDVENAVKAANTEDYEAADAILDVSALSKAAGSGSATNYWKWMTTNGRVVDISVEEQETSGGSRRLFLVLKNDDLPTRNVGFWIRWNGQRWVATEDK